MAVEYMLTTMDNPCDPFTDFNNWYNEDLLKGHNTLSVLAERAFTSSELSEEDNVRIINNAIDEIVIENTVLNGLLMDSDSSINENDLVWYKKVKQHS